MQKTSLAILFFIATALLPFDRMWIAQGADSPDDQRSEDEPQVNRHAAKRGPRRKKPQHSAEVELESPKPPTSPVSPPSADDDRANTTDEVKELREELKRLSAEVRHLQNSPRESAKESREASNGSVRSVFDFADAEMDSSERARDPGAAAAPFNFGLDDEPAPSESLFGDIWLSQYEEPPSDFGAVPGQHIRPRRTDELGSIGFPEIRPYKPDMLHKKRKVEAEFAEGLTVRTDDDYFSLTFHNLTQVDGRAFNPSGDPLHDTFNIPRQRWYVLGNVSPYVRYYTVINRGFGSLDVLDAWADFAMGDIDRDKLQVRVGRMKTPYTYEYIKISENDLIAPERSVFLGNFAPNREIGVMAHGQIYDKKLEYALGLFNGPRRSFQDFNNGKDLFTFLNTKPFLDWDCDWLKQLNIGGSWNWGKEHQPLQPSVLTTANDQSSTAIATDASPSFLAFGKNVFEDGQRMQWSGDLAYYYKSLGILAGYQGGYQDYAIQTGTLPGTSADPNASTAFVGVTGSKAVRVPMTGYSVAAFYFLTGEEVTRRRELLEPKKEYVASKLLEGNIGAFEGFNRIAYIDLGSNVFTGGLADPTVNSARALVFDNGVNWYMNHYTKITFDWQYCEWATPVFLAPGKTTSFTNLFWFRTQVFF